MAVESFSTEKNNEMKSSINTKRKGRYLDHWAPLLIVVIILGKIIVLLRTSDRKGCESSPLRGQIQTARI